MDIHPSDSISMSGRTDQCNDAQVIRKLLARYNDTFDLVSKMEDEVKAMRKAISKERSTMKTLEIQIEPFFDTLGTDILQRIDTGFCLERKKEMKEIRPTMKKIMKLIEGDRTLRATIDKVIKDNTSSSSRVTIRGARVDKR